MAVNRRREDMDNGVGISAGRFVNPEANRILPPVRDFTLEGLPQGMGDPANPFPIRIDYEHAYHFGAGLRPLKQ